MVVSLRERQQVEIDKLEKAIAALEPKANAEDLAELKELRREMKAALDV